MTLPAPHLDDRRFQDLVDEAKRMVQRRCPEWTDHNVSDPGVTLIETFAYMVDQLIYRVNRVPDRMYVKFLDLLGVESFPPTAASTDVTFWLSAPQPADITIPRGSEIATLRTEAEEAITFSVTDDLTIPPVRLERVASSTSPQMVKDRTDAFELGVGFDAFSEDPKDGDALFLALSRPAPGCILLMRFDCELRGVGVDPTNPPIAWEAWSGSEWIGCRVLRDETGGLNRAGDVVLHLPSTQAPSTVGGHVAPWVRCSVRRSSPDQAGYTDSPRIKKLTVAAIGGTTWAVNAQEVTGEIVGISDGVPGQRFALRHSPVVPGLADPVLEVSGGQGWEPWSAVSTFANSGAEDHHFKLDSQAGEVQLGPAVRERDGTLRQFGAVPAAGSTLRLRSYQAGGGRRGNVAAGAISVLKSSIPFVARVENAVPAMGGVDAEDIEALKARGPMMLRSRNRAVTPEDYEHLVREVAPEIARVRCIPANADSAGSVRIMVVAAVESEDPATLSVEQLVPPIDTMRRIVDYLEYRRIIGVRVAIEPPRYKGITVVARIRSSPRSNPEQVKLAATRAVHRYLHPTVGGPDGDGWIFGRAVSAAEILGALDAVPDTDAISEVLLFPANLKTGARAKRPVDRFVVHFDELPFSYHHQILVEE